VSMQFRRLWMQVTADKRRFRALVAVCAVGVVVWAKPMGLFIWARMRLITGIPRTAMADEPIAADAPKAPEPSLQAPIAVALDDSTDRDPFLVSGAIYPKPIIPDDFSEGDGKSDPRPADDPEEAEKRLTNRLREMAAEFRLEALMSGLPVAVINGSTVEVGQAIPAKDGSGVEFRLIEIRQRSVILEAQNRLFELEMSAPLTPSR
jgi:hypothetical protein